MGLPTTQVDRRRDPRRAPRERSRVSVHVEISGRTVEGRIFDISATGIAVDISGPFFVRAGEPIRIKCKELGLVTAFVRWSKNNRIGAEFDRSSNAAAQVESYFRFYSATKAGKRY